MKQDKINFIKLSNIVKYLNLQVLAETKFQFRVLIFSREYFSKVSILPTKVSALDVLLKEWNNIEKFCFCQYLAICMQYHY